MAHARKQIRDAVRERLQILTSDYSIFVSRVYPLEEGKLPAILIYTKSEEVEYQNIKQPRTQGRTLAVAIEIYVKANLNSDNVVDDIARQIEELIGADVTLGSLVKDIKLQKIEISITGAGDVPVCTALMTYEVMYRTSENAPDQIIN
jgi:hypothetical protein